MVQIDIDIHFLNYLNIVVVKSINQVFIMLDLEISIHLYAPLRSKYPIEQVVRPQTASIYPFYLKIN